MTKHQQIPKVATLGNQSNKDIEVNPDFSRALQLLNETTKNVFITGKAGTGKSTLLEYFRKSTHKNIVVLAPTGVAALNVKGQTIHSFFRFPPHVTPQTIQDQKFSSKLQDTLQKIDAIVIDEVSMVRADLMDCIDLTLRLYLKNNHPFGGVQMVCIGDLYQLPPVVSGLEEKELFTTVYETPYFFSAQVMESIHMELVELEKVYRQKDSSFVDLLNKIRNNTIQEKDIKKLNSRVGVKPDQRADDIFYITLTTTNASADNINSEHLNQLSSAVQNYHGEVSGQFEQKQLPTSLSLAVKVGAQVMLLNNDSQGRWVNGSVGKIIKIQQGKQDEEDVLVVKINEGETVEVSKYTWDVYKYVFDKNTQRLDAQIVGSFSQYPIRLAWAVTIHKSQGKTFDHVVLDIGKGSFAHGQVYVAISRCTSFEGLILKKAILKHHIWMDYAIVRFLTKFQYKKSEEAFSLAQKIQRIQLAINTDQTLEVVYLKADDTKSLRRIKPLRVGQMEYVGKTFPGLEAYCFTRKENRTLRVDRILEFK